MLLAIDVGNTHMVIGLFRDDDILHHWRVKTDKDSTADELASLFHGLFSMKDVLVSDVDAVIIACVVPPMQLSWSIFSEEYLSLTPLLVKDLDPGIAINIDNPQEVGADRIVNSVAAYEKYRTDLVVVDFGTAITFDCVSQKGEYIGGIIAPGISISVEALASRTAKLPRVDISKPPKAVIGKNTVEAIKSGILYGYGGLVDGLVRRVMRQYAPDRPKVVATGGMAGLVAPYTETIEHIEPMLTLHGLRILYEKNKP